MSEQMYRMQINLLKKFTLEIGVIRDRLSYTSFILFAYFYKLNKKINKKLKKLKENTKSIDLKVLNAPN